MIKKNDLGLIMVHLFIVSFSFLSGFFYGIPISKIVSFCLFESFGVFFPGLLAAIWFKKNKDDIELCLWSFLFGLVVLMLEYLFLAVLGLLSYTLFLSIFVSLLSLIGIWRKGTEQIDHSSFGDWSFLLFLCAVLMTICFFSLTLSNPLPLSDKGMYYSKDFLYWIGNSISFSKGIPVQDFRLIGETFYYHYFSNIIICEASLITGIGMMEMSYCFSYMIPCVLLVLSAYYLFREVLNKRIFVYLAMILTFLCEGSTVYLASHLYFCPFGFDYGYAIAMTGIAVLAEILKTNEFGINDLLSSCLLMALCTGMKGPIAIVVLMAYGVTAFCMLLKKQFKTGFLFGFSWLLSFLFVYLIFIFDLSGETEQTNGLMYVGFTGGFDRNPWAIEILSELVDGYHFPDNGISRIIALFLYVLRTNRAAMLLLIIGFFIQVIQFFRRKEVPVFLLSMVTVCLWGIVLTLVTFQDGNSQMYFVMTIFPYAVLFGLSSFEEVNLSRRSIDIVFLILILFMAYDDVHRFFFDRVRTEIDNGISIMNHGDKTGDKRYSFSREEYELSIWLKNNTGSGDIIAIDRFEYDGYRKEEGVGVFSERFIWDDGQYSDDAETARRRDLAQKAVEGDADAIRSLQKENVKYLIQTLSQNPDLLVNGGKIVYDQGGYVVFQLF